MPQRYVHTVIDAAFSAGTTEVTPESMANIHAGMVLTVDGQNPPGSGTGESVQVTAITASTFTAVFVHNHAAGAYVTNDPTVPSTMWGT